MSKQDLLLMAPIFPPTMAQLAEKYNVHRYWESQDKPGLLASLKDTCVAVATSGSSGIRSARIRPSRMASCASCGLIQSSPAVAE